MTTASVTPKQPTEVGLPWLGLMSTCARAAGRRDAARLPALSAVVNTPVMGQLACGLLHLAGRSVDQVTWRNGWLPSAAPVDVTAPYAQHDVTSPSDAGHCARASADQPEQRANARCELKYHALNHSTWPDTIKHLTSPASPPGTTRAGIHCKHANSVSRHDTATTTLRHDS